LPDPELKRRVPSKKKRDGARGQQSGALRMRRGEGKKEGLPRRLAGKKGAGRFAVFRKGGRKRGEIMGGKEREVSKKKGLSAAD